MSATSWYRTALPILMNGGPSPFMRALASQDKLTLRSLAASFGVSRTMAGVGDFTAMAPPASEIFGVICVGPSPAVINQHPESSTQNWVASGFRARRPHSDVDRLVTWRWPPLKSGAYAPK